MSKRTESTHEPRLVERHAVTVEFTIDEEHNIRYWVFPDRKPVDRQADNYFHMIAEGATLPGVAAAILADKLRDHLAVETLERAEMRFRRIGAWARARRERDRGNTLDTATRGAEDGLH